MSCTVTDEQDVSYIILNLIMKHTVIYSLGKEEI